MDTVHLDESLNMSGTTPVAVLKTARRIVVKVG